MFGFDALAAFTHHCETAFDRVRKGEAPATAELIAAVLDAQDHMRALVEDPNGDHGATSEASAGTAAAAVGDASGAVQPAQTIAVSAPSSRTSARPGGSASACR